MPRNPRRRAWLDGALDLVGRAPGGARAVTGLPCDLTHWLSLMQFDYEPINESLAILQLLGGLDARVGQPAAATVVARRGEIETSYGGFGASIARCPLTARDKSDSASGLLWRVSFVVALDVVEYPHALFTLTADERVALALPAPKRRSTIPIARAGNANERRREGRQVRRHFVALATGFAVAASSSSAVGIAAAGTTPTSTGAAKSTATQTIGSESGTTTHQGSTTTPTPPTAHTTAPAPTAPKPLRTRVPKAAPRITSRPHPTGSGKRPAVAQPQPQRPSVTVFLVPSGDPRAVTHCKPPGTPATNSSTAGERVPTGARAKCPRPKAAKKHGTGNKRHKSKHRTAARKGKRPVRGNHRTRTIPTSGGVGLIRPATHRAAVNGGSTSPARERSLHQDSDSSAVASPFTSAPNVDPFTAAQLAHFSSITTSINEPPSFLIPIYKAAGRRYHIPWQVLAAINSIETNYGRDLSVSSAGAIGWMQFMPGTWLTYGVHVGGKGRPNPYDPRDAIFSAARYLAANGAVHNLRNAIFAYNHAGWYVDEVLWRAQTISDLTIHARRQNGYALPLDSRYMHQLGRTDDGVDIETAPDGAAVYSITPGIVTAIASNPGGFGPNYPVILVTSGPLAGQYIYYGHVAASLVRVGQRVSGGQPIAVMGHTGDAASLGHGHIEIGFSDGSGDPLNHHGGAAWTPSGDAMRRVLVQLSAAFRIKNA